ncbi:hypothetical protein GQ53DRAFT_747197 [Thozetella sp. PMI_491]|nr:hypothetical protein GQ53DRAFT_747197 [Thozetella sp. PMI_491]
MARLGQLAASQVPPPPLSPADLAAQIFFAIEHHFYFLALPPPTSRPSSSLRPCIERAPVARSSASIDRMTPFELRRATPNLISSARPPPPPSRCRQARTNTSEGAAQALVQCQSLSAQTRPAR